MTSGPLCLEKVTLDPSQLFEVTALNEVEGEEDAEAKTASVFGKVNCLRPQDSRQYLYCLTPRPEVKANHRLMKGVTNIGKLFNTIDQGKRKLTSKSKIKNKIATRKK